MQGKLNEHVPKETIKFLEKLKTNFITHIKNCCQSILETGMVVMADKKQALNTFWSSFGLIAYDESSVPDTAKMPYITYEVATSDFGNTIPLTANLWYRSTSWVGIVAKEKEIEAYITRGGCYVNYDGGALLIQKASNWSLQMADPSDANVRRIVLNINAEFIE